MIEDQEMYHTPSDRRGQYVSQLIIYSIPFSMFMTLCVSYVYELMGRKFTIFFSYFTTAIVMFSIPYTAPSYNYLLVARCAMGFTMAAPI